jgi:hypothetical protein
VGSKDELLMVLVDRLAARPVHPPRPDLGAHRRGDVNCSAAG